MTTTRAIVMKSNINALFSFTYVASLCFSSSYFNLSFILSISLGSLNHDHAEETRRKSSV